MLALARPPIARKGDYQHQEPQESLVIIAKTTTFSFPAAS